MLLGCVISFLVGVKIYHNAGFEQNMQYLHVLLKSKKQVMKGKEKKSMQDAIASSFNNKLINVEEGEVLKHQIEDGNASMVRDAEDKLIEMELEYREKKGRKWIVMLIGTILFTILGYYAMPILFRLTKSNYDRSGIESICEDMFGEVKVTDALTKEVNIIAYEYNSHEPRIFSKKTAKLNSAIYDVSIADASEASSAAPIYFDPKVIGDQVLIDGGVIANNPAFYSFLHSKYVNGAKRVRVISIGTGTEQPAQLNPDTMTMVDWAMQIGNFMTVVESNAHEYLLNELTEEYYRFQ
jgi:hypothetical protein